MLLVGNKLGTSNFVYRKCKNTSEIIRQIYQKGIWEDYKKFSLSDVDKNKKEAIKLERIEYTKNNI